MAGAPLREGDSTKHTTVLAPAGGVVETPAMATESGKALPMFDLPVKGTTGSAILGQIGHQFSLRLKEGQSEIQVKLDPPSLGTVRMSVAASGDTVRALIITDHPAVKQIIESQLSQLRETLAGQGMKVDSFTVLVGGQDAGSGHQADARQTQSTIFNPPAAGAAPRENDSPAAVTRSAKRSSSLISIFA